MLSNTCKYAIRATVYVSIYASEAKKTGLKEIATELEIPLPFLGKILQSLAKHEILISTKGPNGGFILARKPEDISLFEIVEIIDGTSTFDTCLVRTAKCSDSEPCGIHDHITQIRSELKDFFKKRTINDLATEFTEDKNGRIQL